MASLATHHAELHKGTFDGQYSPASVIVTLSIGLALYNSLEMVLLLLTTFKKWKGLYFWSLNICNFGIILYTLGLLLSYFRLTPYWAFEIFLDLGWVLMVTFQALVLYSRLGLIIDNPRILSAVKWMIIVNTIVIEGTTVVLDWATNYSGNPRLASGYFYIEHIQMTIITIQELIISGIYVWKTSSLLTVISKVNTRSMVWQLLTINVVIIGMDVRARKLLLYQLLILKQVALVILEFKHLQLYQESIKVFVYSVKLKLELNILSKLVDLVEGKSTRRSTTLEEIDSNAIVGQAQADVRQELSLSDVGGWSKSDEKVAALEQVHDISYGKLEYSSSISVPPVEITGPPPVHSTQSRYSTRTESDIEYADFLRSMK